MVTYVIVFRQSHTEVRFQDPTRNDRQLVRPPVRCYPCATRSAGWPGNQARRPALIRWRHRRERTTRSPATGKPHEKASSTRESRLAEVSVPGCIRALDAGSEIGSQLAVFLSDNSSWHCLVKPNSVFVKFRSKVPQPRMKRCLHLPIQNSVPRSSEGKAHYNRGARPSASGRAGASGTGSEQYRGRRSWDTSPCRLVGKRVGRVTAWDCSIDSERLDRRTVQTVSNSSKDVPGTPDPRRAM